MRLVWKRNVCEHKQGTEVKIGDEFIFDGDVVKVSYTPKPSSPASEGKVSVKEVLNAYECTYYASVFGMEWIEREDRDEA